MVFERILLTTDFSEPSLRLLDFTVTFAKGIGAEVYLMHVDEEEGMFGLHSSDDLIRFFQDIEVKRDEWMEKLAEDITSQGVEVTRVRVKGIASDEILRTIEEQKIDMAALATVGVEGMKRILIGSTAKKVLRHAPCPVLTSNPQYRCGCEQGIRRILFPFDFSEPARAGLRGGVELARRFGAKLELLKVLKIPTLIPSLPGEPPITLPKESLEYLQSDAETELSALVEELDYDGISYAVTIGSDEAEAIADHATQNEMDLIVIPRGGESAFQRFFFGRVAHAVVKVAQVPVLSLPPYREKGTS